jgi:hypothetical protein
LFVYLFVLHNNEKKNQLFYIFIYFSAFVNSGSPQLSQPNINQPDSPKPTPIGSSMFSVEYYTFLFNVNSAGKFYFVFMFIIIYIIIFYVFFFCMLFQN